MPMRPRQNTSSAELNQAEANLTHTAMVAKNSDATSIQSACITPGLRQVRAGPMAPRYHSWKCCMPSSIGLW
jgi:hypothetical protein